MKTTATTTTYRGYEITVIEHTPNGSPGSYYTAHDDVNGTIYADNAHDNIKNADGTQPITDANGPRIWATADAARKASEATIEDTLGPAEPEELGEAAYDLANSSGGAEWQEKNAKRLADTITSLLRSDTSATELARGLSQIAINLNQH